jgi:hypothetical protein
MPVESRKHGASSYRTRRKQMNRWLEYDFVALAMLVFGVAAIQVLAVSL